MNFFASLSKPRIFSGVQRKKTFESIVTSKNTMAHSLETDLREAMKAHQRRSSKVRKMHLRRKDIKSVDIIHNMNMGNQTSVTHIESNVTPIDDVRGIVHRPKSFRAMKKNQSG
jgi:hypothetical protein